MQMATGVHQRALSSRVDVSPHVGQADPSRASSSSVLSAFA